jgi:hypothetical protein
MSPFQDLRILFLLSLFAIVSHLPFGAAANAAAVDGTQKAVIQKRRGLRRHLKPADSSTVRPSNSGISRTKQIHPNNLLESSPSQTKHSLVLSSRDDGILRTSVKRQVQDAELQCGVNQSLFRVQVSTDRYPGDTSWELVDVSSNTVVMEYGNFNLQESIYVEEKCLESNLCYQFTIKDSVGDGLSPPGSYKVKYDNQLIKEGGGDFGEEEESELFGDACASFPSSSPYVTLQCGDNESLFRVEVTTDYYPTETSWELVDVSNNNTVVMSYDNFDLQESIYVEEKCLESNLCYQFTIKDYYYDGLEPPGSYNVKYDSQLIKEGGGDFGEEEESQLFGDANQCALRPSAQTTNTTHANTTYFNY